MNAEHKRPLFAFLIVTVVAAVVFANGLQRQVVDVIRNGASTVVAGTSLLHDPLYVVEEGARIATQDETGPAAAAPAGRTGTPPPLITEEEPAASPVIAPDPQEAGGTGPRGSGGASTPGADTAQGGNGAPGGNITDGGPGRPRDGDGAAGDHEPGGGGPGPSQPDQAEGHGERPERPERPEAHGHDRSDDHTGRRHDDSRPGKSEANRARGHEQGSGHGRDDHKAQRKDRGEGHAQGERRGEAKGHGERGHGRH